MPLTPPIPLGSFLPDQPDFRGAGLILAQNVMPREDGFYGPARSFVTYAAALLSRCRGACSTRTALGAVITFAGTASALYRLQSDRTWLDVSASGGYAMSASDRWQWSTFGSRLIVVGGVNVAPQLFDLSVGAAFAVLSADAPNARFQGVVNDFQVFANTFDAVDQGRVDQIWWSAKGDPTSYPAPGTASAIAVQSSKRQIPDGGALQGVLGGVGGVDGAVFGESRIWRMSYVGPIEIFQIDPVERQRGVYAAGSLLQVGRLAYYLAEDGWYVFDGVQSTPIGTAKFDQYFLDDLDDGSRDNIWGVVDVRTKTLLYAYPGAGHTDGLPNRILAINYITGAASIINVDTEILVSLVGLGYTMDNIDGFGSVDAINISFDSRFWAGGGTFVAGCNLSHVIGEFAGSAMQADLTTSEWSAPDHNRLFVSGVRVVGDATGVEAALSYREEMGDDTAVTTTPYTSAGANRICPQLVSARYLRTSLRVPAAATWSSVQAVQLDTQPDGDT